MNIYVIIIVFILFLLFLYLGLYYQQTLFIIFAFICSIIIVYELSNTGIEYPIGENTTITKVDDAITVIGTVDRYEKVDSFWVTPLIGIFSLISLALIWQAIVGFEENE